MGIFTMSMKRDFARQGSGYQYFPFPDHQTSLSDAARSTARADQNMSDTANLNAPQSAGTTPPPSWGQELRATALLAAPLVAANLLQMLTYAIVDPNVPARFLAYKPPDLMPGLSTLKAKLVHSTKVYPYLFGIYLTPM